MLHVRGSQLAARFSVTTKMPCFTWSLVAQKHCVVQCPYCYARKGSYVRYKNVNKFREANDVDWRTIDWESRMIAGMSGQPYFRWFDSGDIYNVELAEKIYSVCKATPDTKHWIATKAYVRPEIAVWLKKLNTLPNVCCRYSVLKLDEFHSMRDIPHAVVSAQKSINSNMIANLGIHLCGATWEHDRTKGQCGECRACWNKNVPIVSYKLH